MPNLHLNLSRFSTTESYNLRLKPATSMHNGLLCIFRRSAFTSEGLHQPTTTVSKTKHFIMSYASSSKEVHQEQCTKQHKDSGY
eukprot:1518336-Amphidinium_carterae.2